MVRNPKLPCGICHNNVTTKGILCNDIFASEYEALCNEPDDVPRFCLNCTLDFHENIFPFSSIENETLSNLFGYDKPSIVDSLPL